MEENYDDNKAQKRATAESGQLDWDLNRTRAAQQYLDSTTAGWIETSTRAHQLHSTPNSSPRRTPTNQE